MTANTKIGGGDIIWVLALRGSLWLKSQDLGQGARALAKYLILAMNGPIAGEDQEDLYNAWYDEVHVPDLLAAPGVVAARRFKVLHSNTKWPYVATYEIETDDLDQTLKAMAQARPFDPSFDRENSGNIIAIELE